MATSSRQQVQRSGGAYVEDHNSRVDATGSPNHGCNECCIRPDSDRQKRANDWHRPRPPKFNRLKEVVMAKVIEFTYRRTFGNLEDGGSAATRKNHRVLPPDEEISLAAIHPRSEEHTSELQSPMY